MSGVYFDYVDALHRLGLGASSLLESGADSLLELGITSLLELGVISLLELGAELDSICVPYSLRVARIN